MIGLEELVELVSIKQQVLQFLLNQIYIENSSLNTIEGETSDMSMVQASSNVQNRRTGKERSDIMDWIKDIKPVGEEIPEIKIKAQYSKSKDNSKIVTKPITPIMERPHPRKKARRVSPKSQPVGQSTDKFKKSLGNHKSLITTDIEVKEEFFEDRTR